MASPISAAEAVPKVWLLSRRVDIVAILVAGPAISLLLLGTTQHTATFLFGAVLFALLLDIPHVLHTYVRLFVAPDEFIKHQSKFWWSLVLIAALCITLGVAGKILWLATLWVYWQPYHVCKQHFGVATIYARKAKYIHSTQPMKHMLLAGFLAPISCRLYLGGFKFADYRIFGEQLPFSNLHIYSPPMPLALVIMAYFIFLLAMTRFIVKEFKYQRAKNGLPLFVYSMLAIVLVIYNAAYLLIDDLYALILIATSIHAIQYHLVCINSVRLLPRLESRQPALSALLVEIHRKTNWITSAGVRWTILLLLASSVVLATEIPTVGVLPLILVLHHFYLDGIIWKRN